jgi:serine/threonine protein kinase
VFESRNYDVSVRQLDLQTNVLINADGRLHLADFGLSMILSESQNNTFNSCHQGNVRWMAPEMLALPEHGGVVMPTKAADVYSYGCIMLQVCCLPFGSMAITVLTICSYFLDMYPIFG